MAVVTVKQLGEYMKEVEFNGTYKDRFERILKFFGFEATQANVLSFLTLILDKPDTYKKTEDIIKKWKKYKSVQEVFNSIIRVCNIPKIKEGLGDRYDDVIAAHTAYIAALMEATKVNEKDGVVVKVGNGITKKGVKGKKQAPPSIGSSKNSVVEDNLEFEESEEDDEFNEISRHKELHCIPPEDECSDLEEMTSFDNKGVSQKTISVEKLMVYITHLRRIGNPMADMIADLMEYDMNA